MVIILCIDSLSGQQNRNNSSLTDSTQSTSENSQNSSAGSSHNATDSNTSSHSENAPQNQTARIVGVLPGLGAYDNDTSDSETSSSDSEPEFRLVPPKKFHVTLDQVE